MSHNHNHNQNSQNEDENAYKDMTFLDFLLGPTRAVLIHEFVSLKTPIRFCMMYVPMFNNFYQMYKRYGQQACMIPLSGVSMLNQAVSGFPRLVRQLVGGFSIYLAIFMYMLHGFLVDKVIPNHKVDNSYMIDSLWYLKFASIFTFFLCFMSKSGSISHNWTEQDIKALQNERLEFTTHRCLCPQCQKPKVARSVHCDRCGTCIARSHTHCYIFNNCIGAKNYLQYLMFLYSFTTYLVYCLYAITRALKPEYKTGMSGIIYTVGILYLLKHFFFKAIIHMNLSIHNVTEMEIDHWQRLPYMWKNQYRLFYNPFYKGIIGNVIELFVPLIQGEIKSGSGSNQDQKQKYEQLNQNLDVETTEIQLNQVEGEEFFAGKYVNWLNAKYYTVMDIPGSHPMKLQAYKELKRKGVMSQTANTETEMKQQWHNYMKQQIKEQKKQEAEYKKQMEHFKQQTQGMGGHCHSQACKDSKCNSNQTQQQPQQIQGQNLAQQVGMSQEQFKQFQQDSQNEMKQMFQKRMNMMKNQQQFMKMGKQEDQEELLQN